jgi:S-adenosylmethionine-diacylglycerol 3-amino-3-carboxypropyl transferase
MNDSRRRRSGVATADRDFCASHGFDTAAAGRARVFVPFDIGCEPAGRAMTMDIGIDARARVKQAVGCGGQTLRERFLENVFARCFGGLVYAQIWEDPDVDMAALAITPDCHVVAIASGGCNVMSYLIANPARITAVDLNPAHVALGRLKIAGAQYLANWTDFYRFFGQANAAQNDDVYAERLRPHLDAETRAYWDKRVPSAFGRRRAAYFSGNVYRHGLLGRFIGLSHIILRAYGIDPRGFLAARTLDEQRDFFNTTLSPLFDKPLIRWLTSFRTSLYGLGIPPAQYESLASAGSGDIVAVLRQRLERLTCGFALADNYFAWQAFGRAYGETDNAPLPPYLQRGQFETVRANAGRVEVLNRSVTEYLQSCPAGSRDRYVLLDAQDWMTDAQLNDLWTEITRTARPGARVIFRTAAVPSLLPGRVNDAVLGRWHYEDESSRQFTEQDRSAIYGGFHLYVFEG